MSTIHSTAVTRRHFVFTSGALLAASQLPAAARAASANGKLRTAHIGVGGMGGADLRSVASHKKVEVAALCDVDAQRLDKAAGQHPKAAKFRDFREMLEKLEGAIDAVVVSTPDHTHAPAAMSAMNLRLPVYCQKPLTHEVFEARQLRRIAEEKKLVTQMGIQVHSDPRYREAVALIQSGAIGKVREVHAWSNKNWGYDGPSPKPGQPPAHLDHNLWLGTAADVPFLPGHHHPGNWRRMIDFGTGTLGDMGVHIFDTPYDACGLTAPNWARTECRAPTGVGHPTKNRVEYEFPGTKFTTETLRWVWYDGGYAPPKDLAPKAGKLPKLPGQGSLFFGEDGMLLLPHVGRAILLPEDKFTGFKRPEIATSNHYHQWVDACLGEGETSASFSYAGPLTEALLLGVVANRFPGQKLMWDAESLEVTNIQAANALLKREYRDGFGVKNL